MILAKYLMWKGKYFEGCIKLVGEEPVKTTKQHDYEPFIF